MAKHINYNKPEKINQVEETSINTEEKITIDNKEPEVISGFVDGCEKLNVRSKPFIDAEVLTIIDKKEKVDIIMYEAQPADFYAIRTENGIEGYCMKQYIKLM